jgi:hypothetical protein
MADAPPTPTPEPAPSDDSDDEYRPFIINSTDSDDSSSADGDQMQCPRCGIVAAHEAFYYKCPVLY